MVAPNNDFKAFATSIGANVEAQSDYVLDPVLNNGFQTGIANSSKLNKVWRQSSFIAAAIAQFVANAGHPVFDDGNLDAFINLFISAKNGFLPKSIAGGANVTLDPLIEANHATIYLVGAITANIIVFMPLGRHGAWNIVNATTGAFTVEIRVLGGTGVVIPAAVSSVVVTDGVTCYLIGPIAGGGGGGSGTTSAGEYFHWPVSSTPSNGLLCNGAAVSRVTYANLFTAIGTWFGGGDGSTTFNLPTIPVGYTLSHTIGGEGSTTVGENLSHTHVAQVGAGANILAAGDIYAPIYGTTLTSYSGGAANLAASVKSRICIRF